MLAGLVGRSESWLSQVERDVRSVDRLSVLIDMAKVLHVEVEALVGRPWQYAPNGSALVDDLDEVRRALVRYPAVANAYAGRDPESRPKELCARADRVHEQYQAAAYAKVVRELPDLFTAADEAYAIGHEDRGVVLAYVSVYVAAAKLLTKVGSGDLAAVTADRAAVAASTTDSPAAHGLAVYQVICALLRTDRTDEADALASATAARLTALCQPDDPMLLSVAGSLWLIAALVAGRNVDRAAAYQRLDEAGSLATTLGEDGNHGWTAFGPTNVAVHQVSVAAELGDPSGAVTAAQAIDLDRMPVGLISRRARIHLDLAWAQTQRRHDADAVLHLLEAERAAPEIVRYDVMARETLREVLRRQRKRPMRTLTELAVRAGALE